MLMRAAAIGVLIAALVTPALADSAAPGKEVSESFQKACSASDIPAVMKLYEDDATVIWPGAGQIAKGKAEIQKLATGLCKPSGDLKLVSQESKSIGGDYILNVGRWEGTEPGPDGKPSKFEVRTTELLHRSGGKWRYAVDHASIGLPPPPPSSTDKSASH